MRNNKREITMFQTYRKHHTLRRNPEVVTGIQDQGFNGLDPTTHNTVTYSQHHAQLQDTRLQEELAADSVERN